MPKSNKQLKKEQARKEKLNAEMGKQIKKNEKMIKSVVKRIADNIPKN